MFNETSPDDQVTNTPLQPPTPTVTRLSDDSPDASRYRGILQRKIDDGARRAADVITSIQRDQPRVKPGDDDEIACERHSAMDRPAAQHSIEPISIFGLVMPEDVAGLRVDGEGAGVVGAEVEDTVAEERRRGRTGTRSA